MDKELNYYLKLMHQGQITDNLVAEKLNIPLNTIRASFIQYQKKNRIRKMVVYELKDSVYIIDGLIEIIIKLLFNNK